MGPENFGVGPQLQSLTRGLRAAPDYAWQVKEVKLETSKESVAAVFP